MVENIPWDSIVLLSPIYLVYNEDRRRSTDEKHTRTKRIKKKNEENCVLNVKHNVRRGKTTNEWYISAKCGK